jgi:vancomycin resistance protein YoaR
MAVTSRPTAILRVLHVARPGRAARAFVIGTVLGLLLVLAALIGVGQAYAGRILPGIRIEGVELSGLTQADARQVLTDAFGGLEQGSVTVRSSLGSTKVSFAEVGRRVDVDEMVVRAAAVGRGGSPIDEALATIRHSVEPVSMPVLVGYDADRLAAILAAIVDRAYVAPQDARISRSSFGYAVVPSVPGVRIEVDRASLQIQATLLDRGAPASLEFRADSVSVPAATGDQDALRAKAVAQRIATQLVLVKGQGRWKITAARIRSWISFAGAGVDFAPVIDPSRVPAAFKIVKRDVARPAGEATFLRDRAGHTLGVSASHLGRALDVKATAQAVVTALSRRAGGAGGGTPVNVRTMIVAPKLTTKEATRKAPLMLKVGAWTTYYQVAPHNGMGANITVPARRLNGVVVRPGQVFDFWRALGEVSFRTGYRLGGAIVGGHSVEGKALAGGICSASTTLFNAAARGGFEILTRSPHWYYIKRYPLGLDATVSGSQTMRFRNDTRFPVLIKTHAGPGIVTFELWSVPNGRTVSWSRPSVANVVRGFETVRYTSTLPKGHREQIEWAADGMDVAVTRTVRAADGHVIHRDTFVSHYHRMIGITLIGR